VLATIGILYRAFMALAQTSERAERHEAWRKRK